MGVMAAMSPCVYRIDTWLRSSLSRGTCVTRVLCFSRAQWWWCVVVVCTDHDNKLVWILRNDAKTFCQDSHAKRDSPAGINGGIVKRHGCRALVGEEFRDEAEADWVLRSLRDGKPDARCQQLPKRARVCSCHCQQAPHDQSRCQQSWTVEAVGKQAHGDQRQCVEHLPWQCASLHQLHNDMACTHRVSCSECCTFAIAERKVARNGWQQGRQRKAGGGMVQVGHC